MESHYIDKAKEFLILYLEGKVCEYEVTHPWRRDSNFIVLHSLRVYNYAMKISKAMEDELTEEEFFIIQLAAILHDIGKADVLTDHAKRSAEIVHQWLSNNVDIKGNIKNVDRLLSIIQEHSNKDGEENDICAAILKDADTLDEIGALSIFMASSWIDRQSPFFFNDLLHRIETYEFNYCDKQMKRLNTFYGKKLLQDKVGFIKAFNNQLSSEIEGTEDIYEFIGSK